MRMFENSPTIAKAFAFGVLAIALYSCGETAVTENKAPLRQVKSIVLSSGSGFFETSYSGTLRAEQEASLSFKVAGTIQDISVEVGDRVVRDDVLATLDSSAYELESRRLQSSLLQAESTLRNATSTYERVRSLYESGNQSLSALDDARSNFDSSSANVETANRALEIANLDLSYTQLKAEASCAIASVDAEEGENISQGEQVFYANCGSQFEVRLNVPESVIASIEQGMEVDITFSALNGEIFKGVVNEVGISSVQGGATFPVTITLLEPYSSNLIAGLSADVAFSLANRVDAGSSALSVPAFAVGENALGPYTFVLEPLDDSRATARLQQVIVGNIRGDQIEIASGLEPGMRVVTAGVSVLRDSMEVIYSGGQ